MSNVKSGTAAADGSVLGRSAELRQLFAFLDQVAVGPAHLELDGEAGIGKTALWRSTVVEAEERGFTVLQARPSEAERELSFAGLADLFAELGDELARLPVPQRKPLSIALLLEEEDRVPPDARAIAAGTLGLLRLLATDRPLLVAVDDVQWLDRPSAEALAFAFRRARQDRVGVLLARRTGESGGLNVGVIGESERVHVGPLSVGAVRHLLQERFGAVYGRTVLRRLHDQAGGNPFFLLELVRALGDRQLTPNELLPVPDNLGHLVRDRLAALPTSTVGPLAMVAALGEPPAHLLEAESSLDPAFAAGVIALEGGRVRFTHPLLAQAAYQALPRRRRHALHRHLAELVEDGEQRARHLALGADGPDPQLANELEEAAERAHLRGTPIAAAELGEQALRLDRDGANDARARRTAATARYYVLAGDGWRAAELLEHALDETPSGDPRARLLYAFARAVENTDVERALVLLREARAEVVGDVRLEVEILRALGGILTADRDAVDGEPFLRDAVAAAERVGDPALLAGTLAGFAANQFYLGRGVDHDLMERALALESEGAGLAIQDRPTVHFGWICKNAGNLDRARVLLEDACRIGEERGDSGIAWVLFFRCFLELFSDSWHRGIELADQMCELSEEVEQDDPLMCGFAARALLLAHLGDEQGARHDVEAARLISERIGNGSGAVFGGMALCVLELSLDRPNEALTAARQAAARTNGGEDPSLHVAFPIHVEAAIAVGEHAEAEQVLDWMEERAVRLDREWALACSARCRGLLAAAQGDEAGATAFFERALAEHARVQYRRFDLARTQLAFGETLRRFRHKAAARESIQAAVAIFDEIEAALWSAKARRELARISGRRNAEGLTETEQRVAELVASGLSTKEVAAILVISPKTVEGHLSRIYAKLGIRSRGQLARELAE